MEAAEADSQMLVESTQPAITPSVSGNSSSAALSVSGDSKTSYYKADAPSVEWDKVDMSDFDSGMPLCEPARGEKRKSDEDIGTTSGRPHKALRVAAGPSISASSIIEVAGSDSVVPVEVVRTQCFLALIIQNGNTSQAYSEHLTPSLHGIRWGMQWELARFSSMPDLGGYSALTLDQVKDWSSLSNAEGVERVSEWISTRRRELAEARRKSGVVKNTQRTGTENAGTENADTEKAPIDNACREGYQGEGSCTGPQHGE